MFAKLFILLIFISLIFACSSDNPTGPGVGINATSMIGLSDGSVLQYKQTDTTITYVYNPDISPDPIRVVTTDPPETRIISMELAESNWIIKDGLIPMLNLIVSGGYVLHNGLYPDYDISDSLVFFNSPAKIMIDSPELEESLSYSTGKYESSGESFITSFYFAHFGYSATKTFVGQEEVLVTAGAFNAYRFEVDLFLNSTDTIPTAHATEYYSPEIGLVKLRFEDAGFIRTLILVQYQ